VITDFTEINPDSMTYEAIFI